MWMLLLSLVAHAQDAAPAAGDTRWVAADVEAARFFDSDAHKVSLTANDEVQIVMVDGERARVRKEGSYAWVALTALTAEAPEVETPAISPGLSSPITIPGLDGLQLGGPK